MKQLFERVSHAVLRYSFKDFRILPVCPIQLSHFECASSLPSYTGYSSKTGFAALNQQQAHIHVSSCKVTKLSYVFFVPASNKFENPYEEELNKKKRKDFSYPMVLLLDENDQISTVPLNKAEKIAKGRDLKLIKLEDDSRFTTGNKDVYKLMSSREYRDEMKIVKEASKANPKFKGVKVLMLKSSISPNDMTTKIRKAIAMVEKMYIVKIAITSSLEDKNSRTDIFESIKSEVMKNDDFGIHQVQEANTNVKFLVCKSEMVPFIHSGKHRPPMSKVKSSDTDKEKDATS